MSEAFDFIRARIEDSGPIPFDDFMAAALYGPGGFFTGKRLRSVKAGDFLTSPEVSPRFGTTLARFVAAERERLGDPFRVIEAGGGSGSLLAPLLSALDVEAWAVEVSPPAREALAGVLPPAHVVSTLEDAVDRGMVIANELLDNLPMAVAVRSAGGWLEQYVGVDPVGLVIEEQPARPDVHAWADRFAGPVAQGAVVEVQLAACAWLAKVLELLGSGTVVVIDYGGTADELLHRRALGTMRTYRSHHLGPDPLAEPGATDITADVNFSALLATAEAAGATVELVRQDDFLTGLGLRDELSDLRRHELELARAGDELARLRVRSDRTEAETLLNPRGLGDFRVLIARIDRR